VARWKQDFGRTGVTLQDVVTAYTPPGVVAKGTVLWDSGVYNVFITSGAVREGTVIQRFITPPGNGTPAKVVHEALLLQPALQQQGIGRHILAESFRLYERLGVAEVPLGADVDVGSYAWARYGFDYDATKAGFARGFHEGTLRRANLLADWGVLTAAQARDLAKASTTPGGGIWKVADARMKTSVAQASRVVDAFLSHTWYGSNLAQDLTPESIASLRADAATGVIPIGKLLLLNRYWPARFRMNNPAQRDRLRAYVGRDVFKD